MSLILDKARELADAIANSPELAALREAEGAIQNDASAQELIEKYQGFQQQHQSAFQQEGGPDELVKEELSRLEDALEAHPSVGPYLRAQHQFEQTMHSLNYLITKAINGEGDTCSSGGCSGCGGSCG